MEDDLKEEKSWKSCVCLANEEAGAIPPTEKDLLEGFRETPRKL